jgi:hypothetical protein
MDIRSCSALTRIHKTTSSHHAPLTDHTSSIIKNPIASGTKFQISDVRN